MLDLPRCRVHPGAPIRRYRTPGVKESVTYLQCIPQNRADAHMIAWPDDPDSTPDRHGLSSSELGILVHAAAGMTVLESAARRRRSAETVKSQRRSILAKLDARNMAQAVAIAVRDGLIETPASRQR
ncbi:MAG: helix-turn-helix domain-containing protein [Gaiellales bacterium]